MKMEQIASLGKVLTLISFAVSVTSQICPLTGIPPLATYSGWYRCPDVKAAGKTCCAECTDLGIGLSLVSSNASTILNAISPVLLPALKQEDISFCTVVYPSASCQDNLEQLACAMQCNPDSWRYVNVSWTGRTFSICQNFSEALMNSCKYAQIKGSSATENQTFLGDTINPKYFLQALANAVTAIVGLPNFQMNVVTDSDMCYGGPVIAPDRHVCCDELGVATSCPPSAVNFVAKPWMAPFSGKYVDNNTCRAAPAFPLAPVTPLSPPPPNPPAPFPPGYMSPPLSFNSSNNTQLTGNISSYPPPPRSAPSGAIPSFVIGVLSLVGALILLG